MTINLTAPQMTELKPRIVVVGVGGAGGNAVNNMIASGLDGVDFVVANTDAQALLASKADRTIQLGANITQGLGCGARPDIGRAAAEEAIDHVVDHLAGTHMAFIAAGMGGGTGTGAAPVIAEALRQQGILTVGVVTKPFQFEGGNRMRIAEQGIEELQGYVDTLIVIPNQNLFRIANEKTTFADAFSMADNVLHAGVRGVTDLMVLPGLINLDFADVKTVMGEMGKAMMGTGESEGERRAIEAAEAAISNPLLDDVSMRGARGVLINITGGMDLTLYEVDEAANRIREEVEADANIIVGSALDDSLNGRMRVSLVATGIEVDASSAALQQSARRLEVVGGKEMPATEEPADSPSPTANVEAEAEVAESTALPLAVGGEEMSLPLDDIAAPEPVAPETAVMPETFEHVPPPKPVQPSPDQIDRQMTASQPAPQAAEHFIAPEPVVPDYEPEELGQPDAWAEAEVVNAGPDATPKSRLGGLRSIFGRRERAKQPERMQPQAKQEPALRSQQQSSQPAAATVSAPVTTPVQSASPAPAPAPQVQATPTPTPAIESAVPPQPAATESERLVPRAPEAAPSSDLLDDVAAPAPAPSSSASAPAGESEDLLEIPSFLRRQVN